MPLLFHKNIRLGAEVGVWDIQEDESYFLDLLNLHELEQAELDRIKGRKRTEWLAVRYLLHIMSGRTIRAICLKDEFGKPFLQNSEAHISISHSHQMAAVIAGKSNVGIDIQYRVNRIKRIAHKFISDQEYRQFPKLEIEHMHLIWGAKECLYKAYGRRQLNFRTDMLINKVEIDGNAGAMLGKIMKDGINLEYELHFEWILGEICLVSAIQLTDQKAIE